MIRRRLPILLLLLLPAACTNYEPACRDLVAAAPTQWPERWTRVTDLGPAAAPALVAALEASPSGPGVQPGIHALGILGNPIARPYLEAALQSDTEAATEAALALGNLGGDESAAALRQRLDDHDAKTTTRAAAAAALVRIGRGPEIIDFLEALFLAATPYGARSSRAQGLPATRSRWALERFMVIEALRHRYPEHIWQLDEDSSWPDLRDGAADLRTFLQKQ